MQKGRQAHWQTAPIAVTGRRYSRGRRAVVGLAWLVLCLGQPVLTIAHGDLHVRLQALNERLQVEPPSAALYVQRGALHQQHRDWQAALNDFAHAARLNPGLTIIDLYRGQTALAAGMPEAATEALDRFLDRHPEHAEALTARARALAQRGAYRDAMADFTRALALQPSPEGYLERAQALVAANPEAIDQALRSLDEGIAILGPLATLQHHAIDLELQQSRYDAALARLDQLAAASARQETWLTRRGEILEQAGRPASAHDAFTAALAALETLPHTRRQSKAMTVLETRLRTALERLRPYTAR